MKTMNPTGTVGVGIVGKVSLNQYNTKCFGTTSIFTPRKPTALRYFCSSCDLMIGRYDEVPTGKCVCGHKKFYGTR